MSDDRYVDSEGRLIPPDKEWDWKMREELRIFTWDARTKSGVSQLQFNEETRKWEKIPE